MEISQKGIDLIKEFEGCRLTAYKDAVGVWTIGYGHTKGVKSGDKISQAEAEQLLKDDLKIYEANVMKYDSKYHWNQNQFDALVSFAFNIGSIDQLTSNGKRSISTISSKILEYCHAGGKKLEGLERRRKAEKALFDTPVASKTEEKPKESSGAKKEEKPQEKPQTKPQYSVGKTYTIKVKSALNVRKGAGSNYAKVTYYGLTPNARQHATKTGALLNGTRVTCQKVSKSSSTIWIKIPSGWICAVSGNNVYVV